MISLRANLSHNKSQSAILKKEKRKKEKKKKTEERGNLMRTAPGEMKLGLMQHYWNVISQGRKTESGILHWRHVPHVLPKASL